MDEAFIALDAKDERGARVALNWTVPRPCNEDNAPELEEMMMAASFRA